MTISRRIMITIQTVMLAMTSAALPPIIKWAGGKERELSHILENAPPSFNRFFEPFVGGGSVFAAIKADEYFINDKADELIALYRAIKDSDAATFAAMRKIDNSWINVTRFTETNMQELFTIYTSLRNGKLSEVQTKQKLLDFLQRNEDQLAKCLGEEPFRKELFQVELKRIVLQKITRMRRIEKERHVMPDEDVFANIKTAFMGSLYMYYRSLYNNAEARTIPGNKAALFVFIRNYAYSGMFRYNANGEFNVPYGGIGYNAKTLEKKINYYMSDELVERFKRTTVECLDFSDFLRAHPPAEGDFMFLDPPYDSDFSTYAQNEFGKDDQRRLANYLINECKCKWLMIIKNTPFIYSLYDGHGLTIKSFDKKYQVSFMNRNDKQVEHLIIKNY